MSKKIFVVDDDAVVRVLMSDCLAFLGYEVEALGSGAECLEKLKNQRPDILMLDLMMPDMTGLEVLKNIRDNPNTTSLPVIMLSAHTESASVAQQHDVKADAYLQKPFNIKEIISILEGLGARSSSSLVSGRKAK